MSTPTDGGPAFPATEIHGCNSGCPGMTLRDYFAAKAMHAFIGTQPAGCGDWRDADMWAPAKAYEVADAMLDARSRA